VTRRLLLLAVLGAGAAALLTWSAVFHFYFDTGVYAGAVRYWFRDGGLVYDYLNPGTPYGFTYPPFAALAMSPMAVLPLGAVEVLASIATVVVTVVVMWWLAGPWIERRGWHPGYALAVATSLALIFEPVRETFGFGQVNMLLLALVAGDMLIGLGRGRRWAGVGIGLATAIKLTPGVFILYLLVTRQWRALGVAIATASGTTLITAALWPDASREFWTAALWDTNRVGNLAYVSNQSLRGMLARFPIDTVESKVWIVCVLATLAVWVWRVRRADLLSGLALTGILGLLLSPVTWVHHSVWLLPALVVCVLSGRRFVVTGVVVYVLLSSRLLWLWDGGNRPPLYAVGSNLYVWAGLILLVALPLRADAPHEQGLGKIETPEVSPASI
jgi:alpha-1,2-mannosyltransferase